MGEHHELLVHIALHRALARSNLDACDCGVIGFSVRHPLRDPAHQQPIIVRVRFEMFAAAVWQNGCAFQQQQAALRRGGKEPATARFLHKMFVIFGRFKTEQ